MGKKIELYNIDEVEYIKKWNWLINIICTSISAVVFLYGLKFLLIGKSIHPIYSISGIGFIIFGITGCVKLESYLTETLEKKRKQSLKKKNKSL